MFPVITQFIHKTPTHKKIQRRASNDFSSASSEKCPNNKHIYNITERQVITREVA